MTADIIVSLASVIGSFIATLAGILINSKLTNYRIEQLEKKVEKHNSVIERVYELEKHEAVTDRELETACDRIKDLEEYHR
ncbi:MAG: hypothetical protein E7536_08965 [Ruminococcaceae bacterium]|nr:hypothetical protein [Oscillospiraceae bacterium]